MKRSFFLFRSSPSGPDLFCLLLLTAVHRCILLSLGRLFLLSPLLLHNLFVSIVLTLGVHLELVHKPNSKLFVSLLLRLFLFLFLFLFLGNLSHQSLLDWWVVDGQITVRRLSFAGNDAILSIEIVYPRIHRWGIPCCIFCFLAVWAKTVLDFFNVLFDLSSLVLFVAYVFCLLLHLDLLWNQLASRCRRCFRFLNIDWLLSWALFHFDLFLFQFLFRWASISDNVFLMNNLGLFGLGSLLRLGLDTDWDIHLCWLFYLLTLDFFFGLRSFDSFRSLWPLRLSLEAEFLLWNSFSMDGIEDVFGDAVSLDRLSNGLLLLILLYLIRQHIVIFAFHDCLIAALSLLAFALEDIVAPLQSVAICVLQKFVHVAGDERCRWSTGNQLDYGNQEEPIFE